MSVLLARSTDLGNTWSTTVVDNARGKSGAGVENNEPLASIAVDSHHGAQDIVYVGWRLNIPNVKNAAPKSMVATSTDGGRTFSAPVDLSQFTKATFQDGTGATFNVHFNTPHLAVNQKTGALYSVMEVRTFCCGVQSPPPQPIYLATSTDRGKTFATKQLTRISPDGSAPIVQWTPAGGSQGTLLTVFQDKIGQSQGSADIYLQRSTDGGSTWSPEVRLNDDDPSNQTYHYLPNMSVAPNGRVDVAWYDFRNSKSFAQDVYYTYSNDAGATWASNIRATDQLIDLSIGLNTNFDIRQPPGIASADQYAAFGWSDSRLGTPATQTVDVFTTVAQFAPLRSGASSTLKYLAAGFAGLAAAGVIILALVAIRRRPKAMETMPPVGPQPVGAG
jgi:Neuraminidase (sialidase)